MRALEAPPSKAADNDLGTTLLVNAPSLERSDLPWLPALRDALCNGWTVVHILGPEHHPERRIQRVRDLFSLIGLKGAYIPVALPDDEAAGALPASGCSPSEVVVVPGHGVVQLYSAGASASFFPWTPPYDEACRNLAKDAHAVRAVGSQIVDVLLSEDPKDSPDQPQDWVKSLPAKVVFDCAMTDAILAGGRRALMKSGVVNATIPPYAALKFSARLRRGASDDNVLPLIEMLAGNRLRQYQAIYRSVDPSQHLCTMPAIRSYLAGPEEDRLTWRYQRDPLYSGKDLTREDRIEHMKGIVDLLRSPARYEVGVVQHPEQLPVPVGESYWLATTEALFFVGSQGDATRYVIIRDSVVVDGFFQVFDGAWESIPARLRDRRNVANWIERLVERADKGLPTMVAGLDELALA